MLHNQFYPSIVLLVYAFLGHSMLLAQSNQNNQASVPIRLDGAFQGRSLLDKGDRKLIVEDLRSLQSKKKQRASLRAKKLGKPLRVTLSDGRVQEAVDVTAEGNLVYFTTHNVNARVSTAVPQASQSFGLMGEGISVGVWDAGAVRTTHNEFGGGRVVVRDGSLANNHATHVGGTIAASGSVASALGMAPVSRLESFNWTLDLAEMAENASVTGNEPDKIKISNHSYGYVRGWNFSNGRWVWGGFYGNTASSVEYAFGYYSSVSRSLDALANDAPYYLIVWSAGNDRSDNPSVGSTVSIAGVTSSYNPSLHPPGDGVYMGGYETIAEHAVAKNILTVGAVNDAVSTVSSGTRDISRATMTTFSAWGPTDDGRIKPDVVGNGQSVYSPTAGSDSSYSTLSGTSMSAPNVTGSAGLVLEHYLELAKGQGLKSSSLKGLLIHTADDLESVGPDYKTGWGLVNTFAATSLLSGHFLDPSKKAFQEHSLSNLTPSKTYQIYNDGQSPIKVTIVWNDPVGTEIFYADDMNPNLINDLNLKVISPSGITSYPYTMPFTTEWTQASMAKPATTGVNDRDNVEQVYIPNPSEAGVYRVVVDHVGSLANDIQDYTLLVSGSFTMIPVISGLMDGYGTFEDITLQDVEFAVTHPGLDNSQLVVTATSSNTILVPNENISIIRNGSSYYLTAIPSPELDGQTVITINVWDGISNITKSFGYDVYYWNDAPIFGEIGSVSLPQGQSSQPIALNISDIDTSLSLINLSFHSDNVPLLPNNSISFSYEVSSGWSMVVSPNPQVSGTANVTINASDLDNTVSRSFLLTVPSSGLTFSDWAIQNGIDPLDPDALGGDLDQDGVVNVMEYFMGLDPTQKEQSPSIWQSTDATHALLYYKKSKNTSGIFGQVRWTSNLSSTWTTEGVYDRLIASYPTYELRCSQVLLPEGLTPLFMRLDLILD